MKHLVNHLKDENNLKKAKISSQMRSVAAKIVTAQLKG